MMVSKWGNSLAVRLPKKLVEEAGLVEGDEVDVRAVDKRTLEIAKVDDEERRRRFIEGMKQFNWTLPEGYKFNRDEANER